MTPEVLASLETLPAVETLERSRRRVDPLVKAHSRRVLESLTTDTALTRIFLAVSIQIVFLQVNFKLKADVADGAAIRSYLGVYLKMFR